MSPAELQVSRQEPIIPAEPSLLTIIQVAVNKDATVDTIERLAKLYEEMQVRQQTRDAKIAYSIAMQHAQAKMEPVRRDAKNTQTGSKYATYSALNSAIRPHYTGEGLSISYNTADSSKPDHIRVLAAVSHIAGHTEPFQVDIPVVTAGPQGKAVMTLTHATVSGISYGKRTLLKAIFDIAEFDDDGNAAGGSKGLPEDVVSAQIRRLEECATLVDLQRVFADVYQTSDKSGGKNATGRLIRARDERKRQIKEGTPQQSEPLRYTEAGARVAEPLVVERLTWIEDAMDMPELKRIYGNALKMANEAGDEDFKARLVKASNARAEVLRANL